MNIRIISTLLLLAVVISTCAMKRPITEEPQSKGKKRVTVSPTVGEMITLVSNSGQQFTGIPRESILGSATLAKIIEETGEKEIPLPFNDDIMATLVRCILALHENHQLRDKALFDGADQQLKIEKNHKELLRAAGYLDFPLLIAYIARNTIDYLLAKNKKMRVTQDYITKSNFISVIQLALEHYYHLRTHTIFKGSDPKSYSFSIQEYLDYWPKVITSRFDAEKRDLNLAHLQINSIYGLQNIPGIGNVRLLYLNNNLLTRLVLGVLDLLPNLQMLNLENNLIEMLTPNVFFNCRELRELYLGHNRLRILPEDIFRGLSSLDFLYLNDNEITDISPYAFGDLDLDRLYLNNNRITIFPVIALQDLSKLTVLNLSNNQIKVFDPVIVKNTLELSELYLAGNPLSNETIKALKEAMPGIEIIF